MITYIIITWLAFGLIGTVITLVQMRRDGQSFRVKHIPLTLFSIVFGLIYFLYAMGETDLFDGFWNKKLF